MTLRNAFEDLATDATLVALKDLNAEAQQDMILLLTRMLNYLNSPMGYDKSVQRQRMTAIVESGNINVGTATTVGTVSNQTAIGGIQAQIMPNGANMAAWQAAVRNRIT